MDNANNRDLDEWELDEWNEFSESDEQSKLNRKPKKRPPTVAKES